MIAVFHIAKDGMLDLIQPYGFQTKAEYGNLPENNYSRYQNCKSEVFCAEYLQRIIWLALFLQVLSAIRRMAAVNPRKRH